MQKNFLFIFCFWLLYDGNYVTHLLWIVDMELRKVAVLKRQHQSATLVVEVGWFSSRLVPHVLAGPPFGCLTSASASSSCWSSVRRRQVDAYISSLKRSQHHSDTCLSVAKTIFAICRLNILPLFSPRLIKATLIPLTAIDFNKNKI